MVSAPGEIAVTTPEVLTVALVLEALQAPPGAGSDKVIGAPAHTVDGPEIAPANGAISTVTTTDATAVPQLPETV